MVTGESSKSYYKKQKKKFKFTKNYEKSSFSESLEYVTDPFAVSWLMKFETSLV